MNRNKRRTVWLVGTATAIGLIVGLIIGFTLFIGTPTDGSLPSSPPPQTSTLTNPTSSTDSVPKSEDPIDVSAELVNLNPRGGWALMADEGVAQRRAPSNVTSCNGLFTWALSQGAMPALDAAHALTIRAHHDVHVRIVNVEARQQAIQTEAGRKPPVRLGCQSNDKDTPPPQSSEERLQKVPTVPKDGNTRERYGNYFEEFHLATDEVVQERFLVEPLWGPGQYEYIVSARIRVDGMERTFSIDAGGRPFRWNEDGGGMGYWPTSYTWRFTPEPMYTHCLAGNQTDATQQQECREEKPR